MVAVKISAFGGMLPAQDDRLLPQNAAALAENVWLMSGALQGFTSPILIRTCTNPLTKTVFRFPRVSVDRKNMVDSDWWEFLDSDTDVFKSPVANDSFNRYYYASPSTGAKYNTKARILASSADYTLGIPAPTVAPGVSASGGVGAAQARSYVYTHISAYGEEGPPSPPTLVTGKIDDTWALTFTAVGADATGRNITTTRIYRTVTTSAGTAAFFFVADVAIATLSYSDTISDVIVSAGNILASTGYIPPPTDIQGFVVMPNGMVAGWRANEIWFCEPYLPHAWPAAYTLSVDTTIVGLGVIGQTLLVLTQGFPYACSGINPISMALSKIATHEPCLSRGSIVSTPSGVLYASPNGLAIAAYGVVQNATVNLVSKDKWLNLMSVRTMRGAAMGANYYTWGGFSIAGCFSAAFDQTKFEPVDYTGAYSGAIISLLDQRTAWVSLASALTTTAVLTDTWNGELMLVRSGKVYWFDVASTVRDASYRWRSKVFETPELKNFAASRVWFTIPNSAPTLAASRNTNDVQTLAANQYGLLRVYADDRLIMTRELRKSGELFREPSGFKASYWQFEIEARVPVYSLEAATSVKELVAV